MITFEQPDLAVKQKINQIALDKGVILISSIGNAGQPEGHKFPSSHKYVYSVGSIDHEDRDETFSIDEWPFIETDDDFYSAKDQFTGTARFNSYTEDNIAGCQSATAGPFCSSWGSDSDTNPYYQTDFVMPGNGVPLLTSNGDEYSTGTSFSAPYLAAVDYVAMYGFKMGYADHGGDVNDLTNTEIGELNLSELIYQALIDSSSGGGTYIDRYFGYGWVNIFDAYCYGFDVGYDQYVPPEPILPPPCYGIHCLLGG
ncbi:MAG: S8 family serine peptidase [Candidatus Heimdallarchaeota archaeon]|nr:S8 family serine peptidase [Candidatus Heimdallarchaeota archaeon]